MENVIELALLAAAAYGVKRYFFTSTAEQNRELFSSRVAILAKRIVKEQTKSSLETDSTPSAKEVENTSAVDNQPQLEPEMLATPDVMQPVESSEPEKNDSAIEAHAADVSLEEIKPLSVSSVPEDSILKRHYLAQVAAQQNAITNPYPSDSVLRRHNQQMQIALLDLPSINPLHDSESAPTASMAETQQLQETPRKHSLPQDSVLKRHALSIIRHEIENEFPVCPSDVVLRRHYHQLIQSKIDAYLADSV